jgi:hypothetical protein
MKTLYTILRNRIVVGLAPGLKKIQLVSILVAGSETLSIAAFLLSALHIMPGANPMTVRNNARP